MNKPRFEKVDDNTIKIIVEKADDVGLYQILQNQKHFLKQKEAIEKALKNIDNILAEAKKLGIIAKEPEAKTPAKK